jgi:hypothetical protein
MRLKTNMLLLAPSAVSVKETEVASAGQMIMSRK